MDNQLIKFLESLISIPLSGVSGVRRLGRCRLRPDGPQISIPLSGVSGVRRGLPVSNRHPPGSDFNPVIRGEWGAPYRSASGKFETLEFQSRYPG